MNGQGLVTKIFSWLWTPSNDSTTLLDWGSGLLLILIAAFLWSTVVKMID